jgi:hypothetical protein
MASGRALRMRPMRLSDPEDIGQNQENEALRGRERGKSTLGAVIRCRRTHRRELAT